MIGEIRERLRNTTMNEYEQQETMNCMELIIRCEFEMKGMSKQINDLRKQKQDQENAYERKMQDQETEHERKLRDQKNEYERKLRDKDLDHQKRINDLNAAHDLENEKNLS